MSLAHLKLSNAGPLDLSLSGDGWQLPFIIGSVKPIPIPLGSHFHALFNRSKLMVLIGFDNRMNPTKQPTYRR